MVAEQPAGRRPDEPAMLVDDRFPVGHFAGTCCKPRFRRVVDGTGRFITADNRAAGNRDGLPCGQIPCKAPGALGHGGFVEFNPATPTLALVVLPSAPKA